jgi:hypothetical protein
MNVNGSLGNNDPLEMYQNCVRVNEVAEQIAALTYLLINLLIRCHPLWLGVNISGAKSCGGPHHKS